MRAYIASVPADTAAWALDLLWLQLMNRASLAAAAAAAAAVVVTAAALVGPLAKTDTCHNSPSCTVP